MSRRKSVVGSGIALASLGCALVFLVVSAVAVLAHVLRERDVTTDTIFGGVCVYLLVCLAWALIYYSRFTLTTIGPQTIHPTTGAAESWTGLEAMVGQFYVAVLTARLVGLHTSQRSGHLGS